MKKIISSNTTRRSFIRNATLTATGLLLLSHLNAGKNKPAKIIAGCSPLNSYKPQSSLTSKQSGRWSNPATWGGKLPSSTDSITIAAGHTIIYDMAKCTVTGLFVSADGMLVFDDKKNLTLQSRANVVVEGKLKMCPVSPAVIHTLRFTGVNERRYVGGGMDVMETDIGLWVMASGALELVGNTKTSWTKATGAIKAGTVNISLQEAAGWLPGDEISIAPTEAPGAGDEYATGFHLSRIVHINHKMVTLQKATTRSHPRVNNQWTAEVMNLTRNVRIEGTPGGKAHIFIRSASPQIIKYVAIRYMGPRKDTNSDGVGELVLGRYALHFHHCNDGSRGSVVKGNVIRDTGNHSYVPHVSHGVILVENIAYNVIETAFWWDPGDPTHDVLYDRNIVAVCSFVPRSIDMNSEGAPTFSSSGFAMNSGDGNVCTNNVVVGGGQGDAHSGGAYNWEAVLNEGIWVFRNNMAHNNGNGLRVWQNTTRNHVIEDFTAYHNRLGIFHGAYSNSYTYNGGILYGNGMELKAASANSNRVRVENITIDGAGIIDHGIEVIHSPLAGERPLLLRNVTIRKCRVAAVLDAAAPEVHSTDIVQCDISGALLLHRDAAANETIRVQPKTGKPYQITKKGNQFIEPFAPEIWGNGKGLKAEYFNGPNFDRLAFMRIDSNISFSEWSTGVHYAIAGSAYSIRWTGQIQPQFSESYTFYLGSGGGHRLWINNTLIIDSWNERVPGGYQSIPVELKAGQLYDIKLEYFNTHGGTGMGLFWTSASLPLEYVPQSQLFTNIDYTAYKVYHK